MRLLYVTAGLPYARSETFVIPEIAELCRRGHEVTIVPVRPYRVLVHDDARWLLPLSIVRPYLSGGIIWGSLVEALRSPRRCARALLHLFASRSLQVFVKNAAVLPKGMWLAGVARRLGIEHVHVHWASTSATVGLIASEISGVPWSFTAHRWDIPENNLLARKARSASFVRAIDDRGADELRTFIGDDARKLHVIHMGVDLPSVERRSPHVAPDLLHVVMAAFFVEKKGHRYAVEAVARLRERGMRVVLDLAGDGPLRDQITAQIKASGLHEAVRLLGLLSHDELLGGLVGGRWDVALLPSIVASDGQKEGIPVFLMEAMAAGIPVVATGNGGIPELVEDAGLVVSERDSGAICDALARLQGDPGLRERLSSLGRVRVETGFSVSGTVGALLEMIEDPVPRASVREA